MNALNDVAPERESPSSVRIPSTAAMALGREAAAAALGISEDLLDRLEQAGKLRAPIRLGKRKVYVRTELEAWLAAGAPVRTAWERMKALKPAAPQARPR